MKDKKSRFRIVRSSKFKTDRPWLLVDRELDDNLWFDSDKECKAEIRARLAADAATEAE